MPVKKLVLSTSTSQVLSNDRTIAHGRVYARTMRVTIEEGTVKML